ncbi:MAG TPA: restriction endonuclease subunit S [Polyangiaceae bacterium LLY-WYZ-15_(1-7)]|nr:hypothetical protein [Sandaracinus sp.]HJK93563.1 restriction endonuclease subunit S [Polyangiaceae bacterium LLY-WYZ-15_(1-7)]MBJ72917.1 hypothetical protein [Sandaracinus sp.]HJL00450.1 restriction endonuclease subunit S [Polyangiaceae bacterium LLY-WYZ-15_(1-7)]HJL07091.1 restriction endonuclease subunit S [Polyangiaceae bacterium LLY-WYZ-15_(1-7)]
MPETLTSRLGDLGTFSRGQGGTKKDARLEGVPCVRYGELYTAHHIRIRRFVSFIDPAAASRYTRLAPGDIVFAASGETHAEIGQGAVFVGDEPAVAGGDTIIFTPRPGADPVFLSYAANTTDAARFKARLGQGSSVIHIGAKHLQGLPVWIPPLPEQRRIAEILDTVDEAIRKTEEIIAKLEQVKQGLLHDLLTRGIDDNGELRDPDRHPEQFKDSPLGRIPKAWEVMPLGALSHRVTDGTHQAVRTVLHQDNTVPFLYVSCIRDGVIHWDRAARITTRTFAEISRGREPDAGMVLYTAVGSFGHAAVVSHQRPFAFQRHIACIYPVQNRLRGGYLALILNGPQARRHADVVAIGNAQKTVTLGELSKFLVPLPPTEEQDRLASRVATLDRRIGAEEHDAGKLRLVKQGLMEDLLTGRVRVTALLEEAAE